MITKFNCQNDRVKSIEFSKFEKYLCIDLIDSDNDSIDGIYLSEKDLFSLIGQLLRIQSEIRAEVKNG